MKQHYFLIIIISIFASSSIYAQNTKLYIYYPNFDKDETFSGYVNANGEVVIPAGKYDNIFTPEFDKIAFVAIKGKKEFMQLIKRKKCYSKSVIMNFFQIKFRMDCFEL